MRILNIMESPAGATQIPAAGEPRFSTTPCAHCDSRCCSMQTTFSTVELLRVAKHLQRAPLEFAEAVPYTSSTATNLAWPFKLDGPTRRAVFSFRRDTGTCTHMRGGANGCGVYEVRPAICRLFPFDAVDDLGRVRVGQTSRCPVQWLQDEDTRATLARDIAQHRQDAALDLEIVRFWNRGRRPRSVRALIAWLQETVAPQLDR